MSFGTHSPLFGSAEVDRRLDASAQIAAFLEVEAALALSQADIGALPTDTAERIAAAARALEVDADELEAEADTQGNVVIPLVSRLRESVQPADRDSVHLGATSQDIVDTGHMLLARRAVEVLLEDSGEAADLAASLAREHTTTPMSARTLMRSANAITFGLKAARWMTALDGATATLADSQGDLAVQLGGPCGVDVGGDRAPALAEALAARLGLATAATSWQTDRRRITSLGSTLAGMIGTGGKVAGDIILLVQDEVAELAVPDAGGSSAMPHKRNPTDAVMIRASAHRAPGLLATLFTSMMQENERAAGAWHAEWEPLLELLHLAGGVTRRLRRLLGGIEVRTTNMAENLAAVGRDEGAVTAEVDAAAALTRRLLAERREDR